MSNLRFTLRQLEELGARCGTADATSRAEEAERERAKLERMTPYERFEHGVRADILKLQQLNLEAQQLGSNAIPAQGALLRNEMMKVKMRLNSKEREMPPAQSDVERHHQHELKQLLHKIKRADRVRSAHLPDDDNSEVPLLGRKSGTTTVDIDAGEGFDGGISILEDGEFQQFFANVQQTDRRIDAELDRLLVGVARLQQAGKEMSQELKVQAALLNTAEQKMDDVTSDLQKTNKKLKNAITEVSKDKMCLYIVCALLLLGIIGFILVQTNTVKS
jgi:hypothetical protein